MADLAMGAMGGLITKLYQLLGKEYDLQTGVKERISNLTKELEAAQAALRKVGEVPWDELDEQVRLWAREIGESSYDMEDIVDTFLVRVQGSISAQQQEESLLKPLKKMAKFFKKTKVRRKISGDVKDIMSHLQEVTQRCRRYGVNDIVGRPATVSTVDPRLHAMYTQVNKLVGIDESSGVLKSMLQLDDMPNTKMKTVSVVGIGGLGKTTLAKSVYDNIRGDFNCGAFVSVGRNPDLQKVLQMILISLDKETYLKFNFAVLQDITQFINEVLEFLNHNKRYFIVIDDIWEKRCWETLKLAIADGKNCEGRIIITTRKWDIAKYADEVYELPALPPDSSRKLFYTRIYGDERKYVDYPTYGVSDEIRWKCAGIPLAIITMASLLVDEPRDRWFEVYKSIGFGCKDNEEEGNMMKKILSFSYYDLPPHLRTCLLYLSAFPEDSVIPKVQLVWMWIAEGFIQKREGKGLFEIGEGYFNDLINRSLIQEVEPNNYENNFHGCRVHDMVLDFIRSISWEENFFTVFDNNEQGTLVRSNVVRRLAHHNKTTVLSNEANKFDMSKVRSFVALEWAIDTWAPISSFKLLRVLNISYYGTPALLRSLIQVEHLGHLVHLRFLGIKGRRIKKIPEEIGALKMLQTLDLSASYIMDLASSSSLPTQLVCLRIVFDILDAEGFSVGRLTSLEELSIKLYTSKASRQFAKELSSLRELRVLDACICLEEDSETDLVESVCHLHKLQHLKITTSDALRFPIAEEMEFVLHGDLRHLELSPVQLWKLPSCINHWCHCKLSHLDVCLWRMDEQELQVLGRLPDLRFLQLDLSHASPTATIGNISDSGACYFPELRSLKLKSSMVLFVANKGGDKKTVSFNIWDGNEDSDDDKLQSGNESEFSVSHWNHGGRGPVREKNDDELQLETTMAMRSVSDDDIPSSFQPSKLQCGKPVSHEGKEASSSIATSATRQGEGTATNGFMPRLQVLDFHVPRQAVWDPRYCNHLGLEFLSSLQEIIVSIEAAWTHYEQREAAEAAVRRAAQVHPNHPTLRIYSPNTYHDDSDDYSPISCDY